MATSPYFRHNVRSEQELYEDLVIESLKFYGMDVYYIPREVIGRDTLFNEQDLSRFDYAYKVEMYVENIEGFDGEGDLFTKFGVEIRDACTFVLARRRWNQVIWQEQGGDRDKYYRPREGDVIHLPLSNSTFEIQFVEDENPFYQLGQLPTFRMRCELFEYSDEDFDTGIGQIDDIERFGAYQWVLTMGDSADTIGYSIGELVEQVNTDFTIGGEVVQWSDSDHKLYLAHITTDDNLYHDFTTSKLVTGIRRTARSTPILVEQLQQIQQNAAGGSNDIVPDFDVSAFEFIDWSESNPFGDP